MKFCEAGQRTRGAEIGGEWWSGRTKGFKQTGTGRQTDRETGGLMGGPTKERTTTRCLLENLRLT